MTTWLIIGGAVLAVIGGVTAKWPEKTQLSFRNRDELELSTLGQIQHRGGAVVCVVVGIVLVVVGIARYAGGS